MIFTTRDKQFPLDLELGTDQALIASGLTNKAFERYCTVENKGAFEVVTAIRNVKKKAEIIPINRAKKGE